MRQLARICMAAAAMFIASAATPRLFASAFDAFFPVDMLPSFDGEFRGFAPVLFQSPLGVGVQLGIGHYGRDVVGAPTQSQLRAGGVFSQSGKVDGVIQLNPGQPPVRFSASASLVLRSPLTAPQQPIPIEILQLNIQGDTLPAGVMIRESPTLPSPGSASFQGVPGGYMVSSHFDAFLEVSLNGGQSWTPSQQPLHMDLIRRVPEHFFPTDCFPIPGDYETTRDAMTTFAGGVVIKNFRHRPKAKALPMPQGGQGQQQFHSLGGTVELDLSSDGGVTFQHYYVVILEDCIVSSWSLASGGDRPMESLSLNFTAHSGAIGPIMIRESPTLPSLGRTTSRAVPGGFMLGSFFDIFTEVSVDGGQTWQPANGPMQTYLLPYIEQENLFRSDFVLPRDGSLETWPHAQTVHFPGGLRARNFRFQEFGDCAQPPAPGVARLMEEEGIWYFELSSDGGQTWAQHSAKTGGNVVKIQDNGCFGDPVLVLDNGFRSFDTEMLALNIGGDSMPAGLRIRESPTRASLGRLSIRTVPRIGQEVVVSYAVDSFFDVFTELSLDNGMTWMPALNPARIQLRAQPPKVFQPSSWLPFVVQYRETDFNFAARYGGGGGGGGGAGGVIRSIIIHASLADVTGGRAPVPAPGASLTRTMNVPVEFQLSLDGGNTFMPAGCHAFMTWKFSDLVVSSFQTVETEILQLDLVGGTLPPGVMLRESPTRASTGRTSIRAVPGGHRVDSFFDIFTEMSLDGGQSWMPSCEVIHIAADETASPRLFTTNLMPPNGVLENPEGALALCCATGEHIKSAKLTRLAGGGVPPPAPGGSVRVAADAVAEFMYSTDDGQTFNPIRCMAYYRWEMKDLIVTSLMPGYDTEMLQLEMWGGNLPPGVMLRESPTRASKGRTSISPTADGRFLVSSFFDVFTELSLDGGGTWTPFDIPMHFELKDALVSNFMLSDLWPPRGHFRRPPGDPDFDLLFVGGSQMSFFDVFYDGAGSPLPVPGGGAATHAWNALVSVRLMLANGTPVVTTANALLMTSITAGPVFGDLRTFDTEMLQLDLAGLPPGVLIRESPTRKSQGRTSVLDNGLMPNDGFQVDSFFDVFFELSLDGGGTWVEADGPMRIEFAAAEIVVEHPVGTELTDGQNIVFPPVLTGASTSKPFTIRNIGAADLLGLGITFTGPDAAAYSVTALPTAPVPGGAATTFVVRLLSATAGTKLATMHIASNDADENPFDIILAGHVLTPNGDDDGDGIPNEAEINLADCDFDPLVNDTPQILTLRNNGFYQASDMHVLALGSPVLTRDPVNGHFHLSLGVLKSPNLQNFTPLLNFTPTFDPATGRLDCDIAPDGSNAQFYRVLGGVP